MSAFDPFLPLAAMLYAAPMTFSWINKQGVSSDEGFSVAFTGRSTVRYVEGDRAMLLEGESMYSDLDGRAFGFAIYEGWRATPWQPPHSSVSISSADRLRIMSRIQEAFSFMDGRARFD